MSSGDFWGDFSRLVRYRLGDNYNGLFYQQGRVLSDSDGTTQTRLVNDWQHIAGSDIIGRGVVAIPSARPDSFKINSVIFDATNKRIMVKVIPGWAWVNGRVVFLESEETEVSKTAEYLGPPFNEVPTVVTPGSLDAIILVVKQGVINAFQKPDQLLEPALGGPDTTEMLHTSFEFKLLRLSRNDSSCSSIADKLKDSDRGKLTVSLHKPPPVSGECPVDENFGYSGSTHNMYSIAVAEVNDGSHKFKWSQFNGGLVGRGNYTDPTRSKMRITHNMQAITWSGLTDFYLEIITFDEEAGIWKTKYGTTATMNSEKDLELSSVPTLGTIPPPDDTNGIFFRLWNGIRNIGDFTEDTPPSILIDGIQLKFDIPTPSNYHPLDYWTFEVRSGGLKNPEILLQDSLPQGIRYERVPLAIVEWNSVPDSAIVNEDCRVIFPPLIDQNNGVGCCCCSITVGDGVSSHGNYDSLQDAINNIGDAGGEICLLNGEHRANVIIKDKKNLVIRGCGSTTKLANNEGKSPIITIINSNNIMIKEIEFQARAAVAIRLEGSAGTGSPTSLVENIKILDNTIRSTEHPRLTKAIIEVINAINVDICNNNLLIQEGPGAETGIYLLGRNILVLRNIISLVGAITKSADAGGGLQIGSGSENISIEHNKIDGGNGNGITIGDPTKPGGNDSFIYQININNNDISGMGLSGIGLPRLLSDDQVRNDSNLLLGTPILGIQISENRISNCVRIPFDETMIKETTLSYQGMPCRGFGGILLSWCEKVTIKDNKIEDNGRQHTDPICGIFMFYASEVQLVQNYIFDNGPKRQSESLKVGTRGGIVIIFSTGRNIASDEGLFGENYAARVHHNVVSQPAGRALLLGALGMVSVVDNYFNSELSDVTIIGELFKSLKGIQSGCVSIFNPVTNVGLAHAKSHVMAISRPQLIGGTIFENNQSRLGQYNTSQVSHYIVTESDLCFGHNQVNCINDTIRTNTYLHSATLRACDNRLGETMVQRGISLYSVGTLMNNTSNNQGDHCIVALGSSASSIPVVNTGNQVLNPSGCVRIHENISSKASEVLRSYE